MKKTTTKRAHTVLASHLNKQGIKHTKTKKQGAGCYTFDIENVGKFDVYERNGLEYHIVGIHEGHDSKVIAPFLNKVPDFDFTPTTEPEAERQQKEWANKDKVAGVYDATTGSFVSQDKVEERKKALILTPDKFIKERVLNVFESKKQELREGAGFLANRFYIYNKESGECIYDEKGEPQEIFIQDIQSKYSHEWVQYKRDCFNKKGAENSIISKEASLLGLRQVAGHNKKHNPVQQAFANHIQSHTIHNKDIIELEGDVRNWTDEKIQKALNTIIKMIIIPNADILHTGNGGTRPTEDVVDILQSVIKAMGVRGRYGDYYAIKYEVLPCFIGAGGVGKDEFIEAMALDRRHIAEGDFESFTAGGHELMAHMAGKSILLIPEAIKYGHTAAEKIRGGTSKTIDRGRARYNPHAIDVSRQWIPVVNANTFDITDTDTVRRYFVLYFGGTGEERNADVEKAQQRNDTIIKAFRDAQYLAGILIEREVERLQKQKMPHSTIELRLKKFLYIKKYFDKREEMAQRKEEEYVELLRDVFEGNKGYISTRQTQSLLEDAYKIEHPDARGVPYGEALPQRAIQAIKYFGGVQGKRYNVASMRVGSKNTAVWLVGYTSNELAQIRNKGKDRDVLLKQLTGSTSKKQQETASKTNNNDNTGLQIESNPDFEINKDYTIPQYLYAELIDYRGDNTCRVAKCEGIGKKSLKGGSVICENHIA